MSALTDLSKAPAVLAWPGGVGEVLAEVIMGAATVLADVAESPHADALLAAALRAERVEHLAVVRSNALAKAGQWSPTVGSFVASAVSAC